MIYVAVSMYHEAKPLIHAYSLKKDNQSTRFQISYNEMMYLIITKPGKVNAAIAISELFMRFPPTVHDVLINIGIAAMVQPNNTQSETSSIGSCYLCNKIIDQDTSRTYYPDVIFRHPFKEASLMTCSKIYINEGDITSCADLIDMEASGIYQAASLYIQLHQIFFVKLVSDDGSNLQISPEWITKSIESILPKTDLLLHTATDALAREKDSNFTEEETNLLLALQEALHCSVTMTHQWKQLILYAKLSGIDITKLLAEQLDCLKDHPCKSKKEGKVYLERIKSELL